jgi:O-antigen/teichoic acid export membrane protein
VSVNKEFGKTLGHAGIYTIGIILGRAVSFIMLPIYTRYLTPADYGVLEILELTVDVVSIVAGVGVLNGFSKFYYECRTDNEKKKLISTIYILIGTFYLVACLFGVVVSSSISKFMFGSTKYSNYVLISFLNLFFMMMFHTNMYYLRTMQKSVLFVGVSSVDLVLKLSLNILFVIKMKMGIYGILISTLLSFLLISGGMTVYTLSRIGIHYSREMANRLLRFGAPFVISGFGAFILTYSDRFFLNHYANLSSVGIYSLAYKFGFLLMMFPVNPFMSIWLVQRFELVGKDGYEQVFNKFLTWFSIITLSVALFTAMVVRDVLRVMSAPAFWDAYKTVPIILLAYFFQGSTDFFNFGIYQSGKTKHVAYGTILAAVIITILSFILIPRYGSLGAALATLVAFFVRLVYFYLASQNLFRIKYNLMNPVLTTFLSIFIFGFYHFGIKTSPVFEKIYVSLPFTMSLLFLFIFMLTTLKVISSKERRYLMQFIMSPKKSYYELKNPYT